MLACSFYDKDAPIYTMSRFLPPSKITNSSISRSIVGDGSTVRSGCIVEHSVVGLRSLINEGCTIRDSLIMGADYFETLEECALIPGCLPMGIGEPDLPATQIRGPVLLRGLGYPGLAHRKVPSCCFLGCMQEIGQRRL